MWAWLRGISSGADQAAVDVPSTLVSAHSLEPRAPTAGMREVEQAGVGRSAPDTGTVLHFPIRGEALLVKLADLLRTQVASRAPERDPLLLAMSRCPGSRLSIDRVAYVDFLPDQATYHVVIEAAPDATITLDTTDFDTVVNFVVQYVTGRNSEPVALEAVS
ncbi:MULTISPECIES: hypothetical protein [unclassified Bradyrhizobium]|uniref:hypothetical protein n=1 Tax=unclassified Bradyrhizobium TaxID=2631580 RepID=UPI00184F5755|nr:MULTISPECIES: hypothetical protein [unclassified Bradyrhizobium]MBB4256524.1 hypothetical protein [Bradyrhizobium sp. CIR3A]NYG43450.1 hypothetical protein [Bradyrhizobium sp. IAR9]